jgi:hypothetical protein
MKKNQSTIILAVMLMLACGNFGRIVGNDNIRTVQFLSIFAIGALSSLLIQQLVMRFKGQDSIK